MDPQVFIDAARYAHILAVAIGFGAAFLADYHVISRLGRPIDDNLTTTLHLCHSVIWKMVIGMWVTGLILIQIRTGFVLENFTPKLIAKVITVVILTANAMLISKIAVPLVEENRGRSLMWLPLGSKLSLAGIGAISSASWMLALAMGSSKVLAASGWIVFAFLMPFIYFLGVFAAIAVMYLLHMGGQMVSHRPMNVAMAGRLAAPRMPVSVPIDQIAATRTPPDRRMSASSPAAKDTAARVLREDRPAVSIPTDQNLAARLPAERRAPVNPPTDRSPISAELAERRLAISMAAERKMAIGIPADYSLASKVAAE